MENWKKKKKEDFIDILWIGNNWEFFPLDLIISCLPNTDSIIPAYTQKERSHNKSSLTTQR